MEINLNLIPPAEKEKLLKEKRFKKVLQLEIMLTLVFLMFCAVFLSFQYILVESLNSQKISIAMKEKYSQHGKISDYDNQFRQANKNISDIVSVERSQFYWSNLFSKLNALVPSGITLEGMVTNDYSVTLGGIASSRDMLTLFKDNLTKESCFSDVNLPLSDLAQKDNAAFEIDFNIKADCLKNK
jgi:Tfp pilus assembly protein PilN